MNRRRKKNAESVGNDRWLISYADFITLLFAFFVVMYAISSLNKSKFEQVTKSLDGAFKGQSRTNKPTRDGEVELRDELTIGKDKAFSGDNADENAGQSSLLSLLVSLDPALAEGEKIGDIAVAREKDWFQIELSSALLFESGSSIPNTDGLILLHKIGDALKKYDVLIRVEGFTDNQPIQNDEFPSNWELSAARSSRIVREFIEAGVPPDVLSAVGYGEYHAKDSNMTPEGRARNRRAVILVSRKDLPKDERRLMMQ